jgi:amidohydrolase
VINERGATATLRGAAIAALGAEAITTTSQSLGGEDFAWYVESVPGAMARLGTRTPGGRTYDLHQGNLRIDDRAVVAGAKVLAVAALLAGS